jgi:sortase A
MIDTEEKPQNEGEAWKKILRNLLMALALIAILFLFMNLQYFWLQFKYILNPPKLTTQKPPPPTRATGDPSMLEISSLNIRVPVQYAAEASEAAFQKALEDGVAHYPGTALPGSLGNVYIFGHSSDFVWSKGKFKTAFALLPHINIGDTIIISDAEGKLYTYKVSKKFIVNPGDLSVLNGESGKSLLTLQTSYPLGTALQRYIVVAELVD